MNPSEDTLKQIAEEAVLEVVLFGYRWQRMDDPAIPDKEIWNYAVVESRAKELVEKVLRKHLLAPASVETEPAPAAAETRIGEAAIELLKARGVSASWEHPGYISVPCPRDLTLSVGTADGFWGYDVHTKDGYDRTPALTPEMAGLRGLGPLQATPEMIAAAIHSVLNALA